MTNDVKTSTDLQSTSVKSVLFGACQIRMELSNLWDKNPYFIICHWSSLVNKDHLPE